MTVEVATTIDDLNASLPSATDPKSEGDDHIRLIKTVVKSNTLRNVNPSYTGTLTGGTGVVNLGSGQFYKDASGNVGVGTASPTLKFEVSNGTNTGYIHPGIGIGLSVGTKNNSNLTLATNSTDRVWLDSAGNFGLGVTPSAWSGVKAFQIGAQGAISSNGNLMQVRSNAYFDGSADRYIASATASDYYQNSGAHYWRTAPSGTAGNPITFTQAMELGSSGNLTLRAGSFNFADAAGTAQINNYRSGDIELVQRTTGYGVSFFVGAGSYAGKFDSSGNLLVGTATAQGKVSVKSGSSFTGNNFQSDSSTAAGLTWTHLYCTSSNNTVANLAIYGNGNVQNTNNSYGAISDLKLKENITDASPKLAKLMQVRIVNYSLKADPNKTKLIGVIAQELEQISPGLIEETPDFEEVTKTREVEVPAVEAVLDDEGNEVTPAVEASARIEEYTERVPTGTTTKSVKYSVFVPMLIKGMQEQQAQIEAMQAQLDTQNHAIALLTARLEALEAA